MRMVKFKVLKNIIKINANKERHRETSRKGAETLHQRRRDKLIELYELDEFSDIDKYKIRSILHKYCKEKDINTKEYWRLAKLQHDGTCYLCNNILEGKLEVDHVIPKAVMRGGTEELIRKVIDLSNLKVVHQFCNRSKGDKIFKGADA